MSSPDRQHLRDELVQLLDLQLRVLEKQVFGVVTKAELREYERKHERHLWVVQPAFQTKSRRRSTILEWD